MLVAIRAARDLGEPSSSARNLSPAGPALRSRPAWPSLLLIFGVFLVFTRRPLSIVIITLRWTEWRHALAILAACVFSVFAIERLGYRLTVLLVLSFLVKVVEKRGWVFSLAFAFTLAFGSFFLFYTLLRVPLPEGPLGF